jgi:TetR/AcrR family transcriptional regulator, transcriptional repressor for nem operon
MSRISKTDKLRNRERIVEAAGDMFRSQGVDRAGIADLMKAAGFTHGGFYNHFPSKDALVVEVCKASFADSLGQLARGIEAGPTESGTALSGVVGGYLSAGHRDAPEGGCPSASLVVDAWRQGETVQAAYAEGVEGYLSGFAGALIAEAAERGEDLGPEPAREQAMRLLSEMVGAMALARAVHRAEPALSDEILDVSRRHLTRKPGSGVH